MPQLQENFKRFKSEYATSQPDRRPLKIYASDPTDGRRRKYRISIDVLNETNLQRGPKGDLVEVIDYDGENDCFYEPVDLNEPAILMSGGLEPNESDPRFHQQMVYAVSMQVIENASSAIGHPLTFRTRSHDRLRLIPHAFCGPNAFFSSDLNAILFGYFPADLKNPGENIPGQTIFTCLSHDIIAHEVTHAIIHRLRPYFKEATNQDVMALHEGLADIVALFQRFSYRDIVREHIASTQARLQDARMMVDLAKQFGQATGRGRALRSAIGDNSATLLKTFEPHDRGAILVSAVFDGFFATYERQIDDLVRIATGGTGTLPPGALSTDLVNRVTTEAVNTARAVLRMCFRAFDYLPPVDVTFGDFLRALVTADYELDPADTLDMRHNLIEGFRKRAIIPDDVKSLAEESLLLQGATVGPVPEELLKALQGSLNYAIKARDSAARRQRSRRAMIDAYELAVDPENPNQSAGKPTTSGMDRSVYSLAHAYVLANAPALGLDPDLGKPIAIRSVNPRIIATRSGELLLQYVIVAVQTDDKHPLTVQYQLPVRGGATIVVSADGRVRYVAAKPLPTAPSANAKLAGENRLERYVAFKNAMVAEDVQGSWTDADVGKRFQALSDFSRLHGGY